MPQRNSLSGKNYLPRRPARAGRVPAHIGEAFLVLPDGDPEGSPSDPVTTDPKGEARRVVASPREHATGNTPALTRQRDTYGVARALDPWYVTGLSEGEGCFCVSFAIRAKLKTGLEARPSFSLSLNRKDRQLLQDLHAFFGCGWIRESRSDRTFKYEARSIGDLVDSINPHFEEFPLRGDKARSFNGFSRICQLIEQGDHLKRQGMREIVAIAYEMNLGKRRHSQATLLRVLGEVKG
jgi:LAGLIDADG endonuclease